MSKASRSTKFSGYRDDLDDNKFESKGDSVLTAVLLSVPILTLSLLQFLMLFFVPLSQNLIAQLYHLTKYKYILVSASLLFRERSAHILSQRP